MKARDLEDHEHVVRQCPNRTRIPAADGRVSISYHAVELRQASDGRPAEEYLSATWLEYFNGDELHRLRCVLEDLRRYRKVSKKDVLAVLNAGRIRDQGKARDRKLRVRHEPDPSVSLAYATIRGTFGVQDNELLELLAREALAAAHEAQDIDAIGV